MLQLITNFFNTLVGYTLPDSVCLILAFALVSSLFGAFFKLFGVNNERVWKFATYVSIGIIALFAIADVTNLSFALGGI